MEVCLIIMAFIMVVMSGMTVFLTYSLKAVQENQLTQSENLLSLIGIIKTLNERLTELEKAELRRCKREFDARKKKKTREE